MTDPIADMLTRIRNAYATKKAVVSMPHSKTKEAIAAVLVKSGYVESTKVEPTTPQKTLIITLKYVDRAPALSHISRVSSPGRRVYVQARNIAPTLAGYGLTILSTNQGMVSDKEAKAKKIGGEVICRVW